MGTVKLVITHDRDCEAGCPHDCDPECCVFLPWGCVSTSPLLVAWSTVAMKFTVTVEEAATIIVHHWALTVTVTMTVGLMATVKRSRWGI